MSGLFIPRSISKAHSQPMVTPGAPATHFIATNRAVSVLKAAAHRRAN